MSCSISAYTDDLADYYRLCKLLGVPPNEDSLYDELDELKHHNNIEYKNYQYQLKEINEKRK